MKKVVVALFLCLLYIPAMLFAAGKVTGANYDLDLGGFVDKYERPDFSLDGYMNRDFQTGFENWFGSTFRMHNIYTRVCQTLNFNLFHKAVKDVGGNRSIFELPYIFEQYALNGEYDYSIPSNQEQMQSYVSKLIRINELLNEHGKHLYIYVAPSKASMYEEDIPFKWQLLKGDNPVTMHDYLRSLLSETDIPYFYPEDIAQECNYPLFYPTGIHWSRPYAQLTTNAVMEDLEELTGLDYRDIVLTNVESNSDGFGRDLDMLSLCSVWTYYNLTYYQYQVMPEYPDSFDARRILIYGDSFGEDLFWDTSVIYPYDEIYYINYDNYIKRVNGEQVLLEHNFDNMDFQYYLDNTDVVVIENCYPNLRFYSNGFVDALLAFLETYEEGDTTRTTISSCDLEHVNEEVLNSDSVWGISFEGEGSNLRLVTCNDARFIIEDPDLSTDGLEVDLKPYEGDSFGEAASLYVYVDGHLAGNFSLDGSSFVVSEDNFTSEDGIYEIEIMLSNCQNATVNYIGGER